MQNVKKLFHVLVLGGALLSLGSAGCGGEEPGSTDPSLLARVRAGAHVPEGARLPLREVPASPPVAVVDGGADDGGTCTGGCWLSWV